MTLESGHLKEGDSSLDLNYMAALFFIAACDALRNWKRKLSKKVSRSCYVLRLTDTKPFFTGPPEFCAAPFEHGWLCGQS